MNYGDLIKQDAQDSFLVSPSRKYTFDLTSHITIDGCPPLPLAALIFVVWRLIKTLQVPYPLSGYGNRLTG